jgi:TetR/AcrR family transcriptional repressor of nem operon
MATRANSSRERILSTAEAMILEHGFAGTTIDDIIDKAAITKGGFFYHFEGKRQLAKALVERYIALDSKIFTELSERADTLSEDPLQRTIIFLNLFAEMVAGMYHDCQPPAGDHGKIPAENGNFRGFPGRHVHVHTGRRHHSGEGIWRQPGAH